MSFAIMMLRSQLATNLPYPEADFEGQTVIVTGGNRGLGLEAARHMVRLGAIVILAVRNTDRGQAAADSIAQSTGRPRSRISVWPLDLSSHKSVSAFAKKVNGLNRLDAVVQNAAMDDCSEFVTSDGSERHIATNVINPVLLGLLVLPKLRESAVKYRTLGRLAFVGSALLQLSKFQERYTEGKLLEALNDPEKTNMEDRYRVSRLLLLYAVRSMAAAMPVSKKSPVIINYVTPGLCNTNAVHKRGIKEKPALFVSVLKTVVMAILARTPEQGSRTLVDAVKPDTSKEFHGAYLRDCSIFPTGDLVDSLEGQGLQRKFFTELQNVLERIHPGSTIILSKLSVDYSGKTSLVPKTSTIIVASRG